MKALLAKLTPVKFRTLLIVIMVLLLMIGVGGFYLAQSNLSSKATETSAKVAEAEASKNSIDSLRLLEKELERLTETRKRTQSIVAESQSYQYQDQIIADLNNYAAQSGLVISQFNFNSGAATASGSPAPAATPATPTAGTTPATSGLKSTSVGITLNQPIEYTKLLNFIRSVEKNLTKMQIQGIALTPGESANTVSTQSLNIEVYIK